MSVDSGDFPKEAIAGVGFVSEGTYGSINVAGMGTGRGDTVVQDRLDVAGAYRHRGHLTVERLEVAGMLRVRGDLDCERAEFAGTGSVSGDMRAEAMDVAGRVRVAGDVRGTAANVAGMLRVGRGLALERLVVGGGSIRVGALLTAEKIELRLRRSSSARSVGGDLLVVHGAPFWWWGASWPESRGWDWDEEWDEEWTDRWDDRPKPGEDHPGHSVGDDPESAGDHLDDGLEPGGGGRELFRAREIEVDRVDLAGTRADVIRADRVVLRAGCRVKRVEAHELRRHPSARVGRFVQR